MFPEKNIAVLKTIASDDQSLQILSAILSLYLYLTIKKDDGGNLYTNYRQLAGALRFGIVKIRRATFLLKKHKLVSIVNLGPGLGTKFHVN